MSLITYAIPLFILSLVIEVIVDRWKGTGFYRLNDAINSLSMGTLSQTFGLFTKIFGIMAYAYFGSQLALFQMDSAWFDPTTLSGLLALGAALVAYDFLYYWKHRAGHEISYFWAAHAVHHQSEDYNLSTALRQTGTGFFIGWVFYLPLMLIGLPRDVFLTVGALDLIYQFWVHTRHIDRCGWMEWVFVTPSNHRVHHAQNKIYIDKNYGGIFIIWDRIFGTFQDELREEPVVFGVTRQLKSWNPFWANLQVYAGLLQTSREVDGWANKLRVWIKPPGWRPADFTPKQPAPPKKEFVKFDPRVSKGVAYYVFFQFLVCVLLVPALLLAASKFEMLTLLFMCLPLWATLYSLGNLTEGRTFAAGFETVRIAILALALGALAYSIELPLWQIATAAVYLLVSAGALLVLHNGDAFAGQSSMPVIA